MRRKIQFGIHFRVGSPLSQSRLTIIASHCVSTNYQTKLQALYKLPMLYEKIRIGVDRRVLDTTSLSVCLPPCMDPKGGATIACG